ncbi:MAG: transposase [Candidatus Peribacteraceae bacterium]|jgi:REP element-mobilizing transposase RayT
MSQRHPILNDSRMLVTTVTKGRYPFFLRAANAREAAECLYRVQSLHPFLLYSFVIMPDHCHFLLRVPPPETIVVVMGSFKSGLTFDTGIPKLWQRRYHIRIARSSAAVLRYIHSDPVRNGLAENNADYPWSSACGRWPVSPLDE